jgi:uncharacterized protein
LKKLYLFAILGLTVIQYSCGQSPKADTKKTLNAYDTSTKGPNIDSARYIPQPVGWTNDFVHLFSNKEIGSLDSLMNAYEKQTTVEISVATIDSSMLGPIDFEAYTLLMLRTWGLGKKEKNNGILIVIAPDLRRIRIQNGYGIEKFLTNEQTKAIIDTTFTANFKEGKFYKGTKEGILAIIKKLEKNGL